MNDSKGITKLSETSVQITFQFMGHRCRERIKIGEKDGNLLAKELRDKIIHEIAEGVFDYTKTFPRSRLAYELTGKKRPQNFRKHNAQCSSCGKSFEPAGKQVQRSKIQDVYCSRKCILHKDSQALPDWAYQLLDGCKKRSVRKEIEFSLTESDFRNLLFRSGWRCEVSGVSFEFEVSTRKGPHRPFSPSVDRIDSANGYTPENVRLVCLAANVAMNTWGESILIAIAKGVVEKLESAL